MIEATNGDGAPTRPPASFGHGVAVNPFDNPRIAASYDAFDGDRGDLDVYAAMAVDFGARRILDIGCGTGTFAILLARLGVEVVGVDPALAMIEVAQAKPGAERVRWIHGDATGLPRLEADLATMTGNVAQAIVERAEWEATLRGIFDALCPGGRLVFETRDPSARAWEAWNRAETHTVIEIDGLGVVESWDDVTDVDGPLVTFRSTMIFASDGERLTVDSTLRFRDRAEVEADLLGHGYALDEVRSAPDRPGGEFVFVARRPA